MLYQTIRSLANIAPLEYAYQNDSFFELALMDEQGEFLLAIEGDKKLRCINHH